jgi:glutamate-1-semialdehyde 2,1-aminomutase
MTAGIVTLRKLAEPGVWETLEARTEKLARGIGDAARAAGVPIFQTRVGTMFAAFFTDRPVTDWDSAAASDTERFGRYFHAMLEAGVYIAPSQFEAGFMSLAHEDAIIDETIAAAEKAFQAVG